MINLSILFILIILSVINDLSYSKIPNLYVFSALVIGIIVNTYLSGMEGLNNSVVATVIPVLLLGIFFITRHIGAGDIKLFCAIGALMGSEFVIYTIAYTFIFAAVLTSIKYAYKALKMPELKSLFLSFCLYLKFCLFTRDLSALKAQSRKHIIKLSPSIALSTALSLLFFY